MISAVDSSVILDVVTGDPRHASANGRLVACECVLTEIHPALDDPASFEEFLSDWQLEFVPSSQESAVMAGRHFAACLGPGGRPGRIVADFLIGAHAAIHAGRLLARDRGFLRDHFSGLRVVDPSPAAERG
ncbi:MAG: type II toxin-antitoxin system VapC family toxin [Gemmatimonadota bacterium]